MNDIREAPGKTWFWELESAVIQAQRCVQCGTCVAACPSDSIGIGDSGLPELVKMCTGCSLCWDFCPRGGLRYESLWPSADGLGEVLELLSVRVAGGPKQGQDGGVVTHLLVSALEAGWLDGALVTSESEADLWKGVAKLARTPQEIFAAARSFYNQSMVLGSLDLAGHRLSDSPRLALVGTPCEIQGLKALQSRTWNWGQSQVGAVVLTVALMCTKSFDYNALMIEEIERKRNIALSEVAKMDIQHGRLKVRDRLDRVVVDEPVKRFHKAALQGCDECADLVGRAADITVGSVGSPGGWSSVIIRTPQGLEAFDLARQGLEVEPLADKAAIERLDIFNRRLAVESLERDLDPNGPLFMEYEEHLCSYQGSVRAPVMIER
ncbi:MAG: Coenzyme F420 hydrogenase/dehydrogenase, beta subunit C-terminal domain [Actinobacteria bacterium]|nr:Coenzyme F420 hydrogenase/dehydrogenase, beta subunit C-terminal domain [Actinomycetota bacterium]